jgi:hypothetical protein
MVLFNRIINYRTVFLFLSGIIIISCKSNFAIITIENSNPVKEELPSDIQSITLMNRSMNDQFQNYRKDSLQLYFYRKGYQLSENVLDSEASDTTIRSLAGLLFDSGRYDVVVPVERNMKRELSNELLPDTLNPEVVKKICTDYNTDALMVLERFTTKPMADYTPEKSLNTTNGFNYYYYASLDLGYNAFFRIYKPGKKTLIKEIELKDTISWESADNSQVRMFGKIPSIKQALINAGIKIALDVDEKISPTWTSEKRGYFLFKNTDDKGQQLMSENNYAEAGKYWAELAQSTNKKIRSKAEYNLALISELDGNIDGAIDWGLKSFYSYYRYQTETYLKKLESRKKSIQKTE